jgi:hypothetical protein
MPDAARCKQTEREALVDMLVRVIEANRELARPGAGRRKRSNNGQVT